MFNNSNLFKFSNWFTSNSNSLLSTLTCCIEYQFSSTLWCFSESLPEKRQWKIKFNPSSSLNFIFCLLPFVTICSIQLQFLFNLYLSQYLVPAAWWKWSKNVSYLLYIIISFNLFQSMNEKKRWKWRKKLEKRGMKTQMSSNIRKIGMWASGDEYHCDMKIASNIKFQFTDLHRVNYWHKNSTFVKQILKYEIS